MKREPYLSGWTKFKHISFGLVYIFFTLWLIFHTNQYVPEEHQAFWFKVFISYGVLNSIIFANADMRNKLFNVKLVDFIPRFLIFFAGSMIFFYFILQITDPMDHTLFSLLAGVPVWLAAIHGLVFATTESVVWQGFLDNKIGRIASPITAGLFHWGIWSGGAVWVILGATLLFSFFSVVNWYFRDSKNDLVPAIASHTAYNYIKLGLIISVGASI